MFNRVRLLWKRYTPLEQRLFAAVRAVLPDEVRPSFDAQVAAVTKVQRLPPSWSEIDLYCIRRGTLGWGDVPTFPCTDEFRLAEVRFDAAGIRYRAFLDCVGGHIFDIVVIPGAKAVAFDTWDAPGTATLLADPRRAPEGRKALEPLPHEWETFLANRTGEPVGDWILHDGETAGRVALADGEYLVLAQRGGEEFLLQRLDPPADGLFHLTSPDDAPRRLDEDLDRFMADRARRRP